MYQCLTIDIKIIQILNIQILHKLIDTEKEKKKENRRILKK